MLKLLSSVFALLLVAACTSSLSPLGPSRPTNVKTIGIVSLVGDSIELTSSGFVGVGADFDRAFVPNWRFREQIEQMAAGDLAPAYSAVPVSFDPAAYRRFVDPNKAPDPDALKKGLQAALANGNTADAYLVIVPSTLRDPIFESLSDLTGIGIFHWTALISADTAFPFVICDMMLIDAHNFRTISSMQMKVSPKDSFKSLGYPLIEIDGFDWKPTFAAMTPQQGQALYGFWHNLLIQTVRYSMAQLKLT
ncbi:MAG TPA: hypothetical protein VM689_02570 [Aliidongia sp.]|nr:hypothetical protein [Aliidongia sp.]